MSYIGNPIISTDFPKDTFSGNGSTTAFTMAIAPASVNSVIVVVSGITQDPSTYTISGTTLTFSAAPPTGTSNISVRHLGVAGIPNTPSASSVSTSSLIDASVTPTKLSQPFTAGTATASTSGTSIDYTSIPSWVKRITVMFNAVSTSGGSDYLVQIGTSGGIQNTSYTGSSSRIVSSAGSAYYTTGFGINNGTQAGNYVTNGAMTLSLLNSSTGLWVSSGTFGDSGGSGANTTVNGGSKTLSGTLDRVRITTVNGTDTFDAGSVNILYE